MHGIFSSLSDNSGRILGVSNNRLRYLFQNVTFFCFGGTLIQADSKHTYDIYNKVSFVEGCTASPFTKRHDQEVNAKFLKKQVNLFISNRPGIVIQAGS